MTVHDIPEPNCQHLADAIPGAAQSKAYGGRDHQAPLLSSNHGGQALDDTCSSPWPESGRRERKLLLCQQLGQKAHVLRLGERDPHGQQLGRGWGQKGRMVPHGTWLFNGAFIRPPRPTQSPHTHGMGCVKTQHVASFNSRPRSPGPLLRHREAPSAAGPWPRSDATCVRFPHLFDGGSAGAQDTLRVVLCNSCFWEGTFVRSLLTVFYRQ